MIDLHTHILPGIDDGAPDLRTAITMLQMQKQQGVDVVALTPHFYRNKEHIDEFLDRRDAAWRLLETGLNSSMPKLLLGAEVAWSPGLVDWPDVEKLCYEGTKSLLIELPVSPWNDELFRQLYNLIGRRGITPMIAHLDRYVGCQRKDHIGRLLEMGFPVQISTSAVLFMRKKSWSLKLLKDHEGLLISDCHNANTRPPNIGEAMSFLRKRLSAEVVDHIAAATDEALID